MDSTKTATRRSSTGTANQSCSQTHRNLTLDHAPAVSRTALRAAGLSQVNPRLHRLNTAAVAVNVTTGLGDVESEAIVMPLWAGGGARESSKSNGSGRYSLPTPLE